MYDCIVLGGGPGGYLAAERAGAKGLSVLLVEKDTLGGVCLNRGCIPTKTLLAAVKRYRYALDSSVYGVSAENVSLDYSVAAAWKDKTVKALVRGVTSQMKRHHVEVINGEGKLTGRNTVKVGDTEYQAKNIIIATGSSPVVPPIPGAAEYTVTSNEILELKQLPDRIVIIGGGVIGMEFACLFSEAGVQVDVVEMLPEIVPSMDAEIAEYLRKSLSHVTYHLGCRVTAIQKDSVTFDRSGESVTVPADMVLMSVGRKPNVAGNGFEEVGLDADGKGIRVDHKMRTNLPGVYAVGDVTGKSLLAHSAYRMAEVAVDAITGGTDRMRYHAIPGVVYSHPEAASCGLTENQAIAEGRTVKIAKMQMRANGRFIAENAGENGLCKLVIDANTDALIGVHLIGGSCSEMIYGAAALIEAEFRVDDVKQIVFPHPTVSEIIKDSLWELE